MSGARKSFHAAWKVKMATVASAGMESGRITRHRICSVLAPSMMAASSKSGGMVRKNCRSRKM